jgi:hypothetical protein
MRMHGIIVLMKVLIKGQATLDMKKKLWIDRLIIYWLTWCINIISILWLYIIIIDIISIDIILIMLYDFMQIK